MVTRLLDLSKFLKKTVTGKMVEQAHPFPITKDANVPNRSSLWSPSLKTSRAPLPTNTAWLNFVLNEGSMPEYIHPYLIQCKQGALTICFPSRTVEPHAITQAFLPNITINTRSSQNSPSKKHLVTSFDDLSVTLELPRAITVPLVRGCPYITFIFNKRATPTFSTTHGVVDLTSNATHTKHKVYLDNGQTWLIYSSHALHFSSNLIVKGRYKGHIRVALLNGGSSEAVLDKYSSTYPVGGRADLSVPFQVRYKWQKMGSRDKQLLMLSLPIHRGMMSPMDVESLHSSVTYDSIDGKMEAIASDSWLLKESPISVGWFSMGGNLDQKSRREVAVLLRRDMAELMPLPENVVSAYSHGKCLARVARMAMIAEEIGSCLDVLKKVRDFLTHSLTPWMEGSYGGNALVYESKWGALVARIKEDGTDDGAMKGVYDDPHYVLGYFCYAGAVLAKLDRAWGEAHKAQLYTMVGDYMSRNDDSGDGIKAKARRLMCKRKRKRFPRIRNFDMWVLHSWGGGGLVECGDGRRQESSSEAVHAYYAGAMVGLAFQDSKVANLGLTLAALEIKAARFLWHIPSSSTLYEPAFVTPNRMLTLLWANKRESLGPFHTSPTRPPATSADAHLASQQVGKDPLLPQDVVGMQASPLLPISEVLFRDASFVKELVKWAFPSLSMPHAKDTWKGFVYALQAFYDSANAFDKVLSLPHHHDGNSQSNLMWWICLRRRQPNQV